MGGAQHQNNPAGHAHWTLPLVECKFVLDKKLCVGPALGQQYTVQSYSSQSGQISVHGSERSRLRGLRGWVGCIFDKLTTGSN